MTLNNLTCDLPPHSLRWSENSFKDLNDYETCWSTWNNTNLHSYFQDSSFYNLLLYHCSVEWWNTLRDPEILHWWNPSRSLEILRRLLSRPWIYLAVCSHQLQPRQTPLQGGFSANTCRPNSPCHHEITDTRPGRGRQQQQRGRLRK